MSFTATTVLTVVQGTQVRLDLLVTMTDNGQPSDPIALVCRIQDPRGVTTDQDLTVLEHLGLGRYRAIMDTTPCAETWSFQWIANDVLDTVVRGLVEVTPAIPAPG